MQNLPARRKPTYSIEAVDNALQLLQLLRDVGSLRLKDAAAELGVAPSTAHRLLAMLVYGASRSKTRRAAMFRARRWGLVPPASAGRGNCGTSPGHTWSCCAHAPMRRSTS
ncbi:helix-turn-helix domain-containing protein [Arthrobacter sp. fls2-241-R2A-200]|uniref:helix-turn-helix domain-containing protein n=1 Tax=Arthrobacter sp. fls2-241-R2A-200 TaxID=3040281 RepID=UPI002549F2E7|nr:helix-turn-helix domain-containing protein [Arthrobacter sp. fls2-241-R2A-200]